MNILITGGTSGLGKATVELLAQQPEHHVHFSYLDTELFRASAENLCKTYSNVSAYSLNFCDPESVDAFCEKIAEMDVDVLVNCTYVGAPQTMHFYKIPPEDFLRAFENNIIPTIKITQAAINVFRKKKFGKIINIITESVIGLPPIGYAIYASNKAYLLELSAVWNKELSRYNITSNCILPAYMQTNFAQVDERILEQMVTQHPLKKLLTVGEVAECVKFFVDASQQVNGVKMPINAAQILL